MLDSNLEASKVRDYIAELEHSHEKYVSERTIAEKFQMNRSNARRLLLQLEGEGILECLPKRGYQIVDYSCTTQRTYFTIRCAIECEAVRLSAQRMTREDTIRLTLILEDGDNVLNHQNFDLYSRLDADFHNALVASSHDNLLQKLYSLIIFPRSFKKSVTNAEIFSTHNTHREIYEAMREKDVQRAVDLLQHKHFGCLYDDILDSDIFKG